MQHKLIIILAILWSIPWMLSAAISNCNPGKDRTVTRFNDSYVEYILHDNDDLTGLDHYTDRQVGIFRLSRSTGRQWKRFTLEPLTERISLILVRSPDLPSECMAALVVPDPWNKPRLFLTTVLTDELNREGFKGFNKDEWISVVVTHSAKGQFSIILCDSRKSITLKALPEPTAPTTVIKEQESEENRTKILLNVSGEWIVPCTALNAEISFPVSAIEHYLVNQQRKRAPTPIWVFVLLGFSGALVALGVIYVVVMKLVR